MNTHAANRIHTHKHEVSIQYDALRSCAKLSIYSALWQIWLYYVFVYVHGEYMPITYNTIIHRHYSIVEWLVSFIYTT